MLRILILGISIVLFATTRVNGLKLFTFPVKSFGRYRKVQLKYCNYFPSRNKQRFLRNVISLELSSLWGVEKQTNKSSGNVASVACYSGTWWWRARCAGTGCPGWCSAGRGPPRPSGTSCWGTAAGRSWSNLKLNKYYIIVFHSTNIFHFQQIFFIFNRYFL